MILLARILLVVFVFTFALTAQANRIHADKSNATLDGQGEGMVSAGVGVASPFSCLGKTLTPIYQIQGRGAASPLEGKLVYTSGVVTRIVSHLFHGAFIQDPQGDGDPKTSDGLFVYSAQLPSHIKVGDNICVWGRVKEYYGLTELAVPPDRIQRLSRGHSIQPTNLVLSNNQPLHDQLEAYEGMLVTTTNSDLVVTRPFSYDYAAKRNNMVLSLKAPLYKSTQRYLAGSMAERSLAAHNAKGTLFVDTDKKAAKGVVPYFTDFNPTDGYIRVGDTVENLKGVIGYNYSQYRLIPLPDEKLSSSDFKHTLYPRHKSGPPLQKKGNLRVASFNLLNFFNSPFGGATNVFGNNRGARTHDGYQRQQAKLANAISLLDADIIGVMEVENNGFSDRSAIAALVAKVNQIQPLQAGAYRYVEPKTPSVGSDAIAVGLLYRPSRVRLKGPAQLIELPKQQGRDRNGTEFDKSQRTALAQTFAPIGSRQVLTVVVNHFKSKGSGCIEDANMAQPTAQGHCNALRVSAAVALGNALNEHLAAAPPTTSDSASQPANILILGDLNAYAKEDPIRVLTSDQLDRQGFAIYTAQQTILSGAPLNGGKAVKVTKGYDYTDLVPYIHRQAHGSKTFSYRYNAELGSLDHALANPHLLAYVMDAVNWHINAAESSLFSYSNQYTGQLKKSDGPYSSSDHDPLVIELNMP